MLNGVSAALRTIGFQTQPITITPTRLNTKTAITLSTLCKMVNGQVSLRQLTHRLFLEATEAVTHQLPQPVIFEFPALAELRRPLAVPSLVVLIWESAPMELELTIILIHKDKPTASATLGILG